MVFTQTLGWFHCLFLYKAFVLHVPVSYWLANCLLILPDYIYYMTSSIICHNTTTAQPRQMPELRIDARTITTYQADKKERHREREEVSRQDTKEYGAGDGKRLETEQYH